MNFTIELAGRTFAIRWEGETGRIAHVYREIFKPFLIRTQSAPATLTVAIAPESDHFPESLSQGKEDDRETAIPLRDISRWLDSGRDAKEGPLTEDEALCTGYLDGFMIFWPKNRRGMVFLLNRNLADTKCLYRLFWIYFAQALGENGGCFLHAAALVRNGGGYVFAGHSGSGKSTLARAAGECRVFSDDSPIVTKTENGLRVFPSPFRQLRSREKTIENGAGLSADILGLYFIVQHPSGGIERMEKTKALELIMKQHILFFPLLTTEARAKLFDLWLEACQNMPTFKLLYPRDEEVFRMIERSE